MAMAPTSLLTEVMKLAYPDTRARVPGKTHRKRLPGAVISLATPHAARMVTRKRINETNLARYN